MDQNPRVDLKGKFEGQKVMDPGSYFGSGSSSLIFIYVLVGYLLSLGLTSLHLYFSTLRGHVKKIIDFRLFLFQNIYVFINNVLIMFF